MAAMDAQETEAVPQSQQLAQPVEPVSDSQVPTDIAETQVAELLEEEDVRCHQCHSPLDADSLSSTTQGSQKPICKGCKATVEMLRRHLGELPQQWNLLAATEQVDFFKKCLQARQDDGGVLRYKSVRALLASKMVSKIISESKRSTGGSFRPLSFYEKQGYCTEDIEARAESRVCPVVGMTYLVPVVTKEDGVIRQDIEETLLRCEREVKRKREPKEILPPQKRVKKGEAKEVPQPIPLTDAQLKTKEQCQELIDLLSDSEDEGPAEAARALASESKKASAEQKRNAAKAARDEAKLLQKDMKKIVALSHKVITLVKPLVARMDKFHNSTVAKLADLPDEISKSFAGKKDACAAWVSQATDVLKMTAANETFSWDCCSYEDDKVISAHMKDCNKIMKDISAFKRGQAAKAN